MYIADETAVRQSEPSLFRFNTAVFPFDALVRERIADHLRGHAPGGPGLFDLSALHRHINPSQLADVAAAVYDLFLSAEFIKLYDDLCSSIVVDLFAGKAAYQAVPSVRIQMPGQISVNYHTDEWYGHGHEVQNFWLPLTEVGGTNSMFVTDEATSRRITQQISDGRKSIVEMNELARSVCSPLNLSFGEIFHFNSRIIHGTEINGTDKTRVSFDFRMLRDGDDRGLKDQSFFLRPGARSQKRETRSLAPGAIYIGKQDGFTQVISQKYQALLCNRYAKENDISAYLSETELSGFSHHPVLWNMVRGNHAETIEHLILFSALLMPNDPAERRSLADECKVRNLTLHFVAEDVVAKAEKMNEAIEVAVTKGRQGAV
jgi:sporadic carbohydrate cluster protein (TIGR04323 family)